jgi:hypothetical protein
MSKISLEGNASGSGTLTIAAPNTNSNFTLTLPTNSGTIITGTLPDGDLVGTTATQTLTNKSIVATQLTGTIAAARLPAGSVLQVVSTTKTDVFSVSLGAGATSSAITGFSAAITPTSASNKILLIASINGGSNGIVQGFILTRNGSTLTSATGDADGSRSRVTSASFPSGSPGALQVPVTYLDAPNTTSEVTYEFLMVNGSATTQTHYINRSHQDTDSSQRMRAISTITVMEIAA